MFLVYFSQEDFIKLYINHRPVLPLDKQNIAAAFEKIAARFPERYTGGFLCYVILR